MKDLCPKGERPRVTYGSMVLEALKKTTLFHLRFNQEYKSLLPPLSAAESEALKRSIEQDGLHYPIIVSKDGTVLDGHNRLRACRELGMEPRVEVRDFSNDRLREKKFVIVANLRRRHLNDFQKIELSQPLLTMQRILAKQRKIRAGKSFGRGKNRRLLPNGSKQSEGEAVENIAREIGVSSRTYYRALSILHIQPEAIKRKLREGKIEINTAYADLQSETKRKQLIALSNRPLPNPVKILCGDYRRCCDGDANRWLTHRCNLLLLSSPRPLHDL